MGLKIGYIYEKLSDFSLGLVTLKSAKDLEKDMRKINAYSVVSHVLPYMGFYFPLPNASLMVF